MITKSVVEIADITSPCALFTNDGEIRMQYANEAFYHMLGYRKEEFELKNGNRLSTLLPIKDFIKIVDFLHADTSDITLQFPVHIHHQKEIWVSAFIQKVSVDSNAMFRILFTDIHELKTSEYSLSNLYSVFQNVMDYEKLGLFIYSCETSEIQYSYTNSFIISENRDHQKFPEVFLDSGILHPDDVEFVKTSTAKILHVHENDYVVGEFRVLDLNDEYVWIRMILIKHIYHGIPAILCILSDVQNEKECGIQYVEQSMYYQAILSASDAFGQIDITENVCKKMGGLWSVYNELIANQSYSEIFESFVDRIVHSDDRNHYREVMDCENLRTSYDNGIQHLSCDFRRIVDQNKMVWMEVTIHLFKDPITHHLLALMCINNIDNQKRKRHIMNEKALDALTQVLNRRATSVQIHECLSMLELDEVCAFLIFNINGMQKINQTHGYKKGDDVLRKFSDILTTVFRKKDILGRYEKDRFIVLLKDVYGHKLEHRIYDVFKKVEEIEDPAFCVSIGVVFAKHGDTFHNCYHQATMALQHIDNRVDNRYAIYNEDFLDSMEDISKEDIQDDIFLGKASSTTYTSSGDFNDLVGENGDLAYLVNPKTYELLIGNIAFYERLGMSEQECKGKTCYELLHKRSSPCPYCVKANWTHEKFYMYRNYNEILDQEFLIKNKLVSWHGNTELLALSIDLSNNKMAMDLLDDEVTEENHILNGIQNMQKHTKFKDVMMAALENIATFFLSDVVRFWQYPEHDQSIGEYWDYYAKKVNVAQQALDQRDMDVLQTWLIDHKWGENVVVESQESMMSISFHMYEFMKRKNIHNQRWLYLRDEDDRELGIFQIDNVHIQFQNQSYMHRFLTYIASEWRRCMILDDIMFNTRFDALTGLYNRNSYDEFMRSYNSDAIHSVGTILIDINGLSDINAMHGTQKGDQYLMKLAQLMESVFAGANNYRLGGDEFQSIWVDIDVVALEHKVEEFKAKLGIEKEFSVSIGYAWDDVEKNMKNLLESSLQGMLIQKNNQKNEVQEIKEISRYRMLNELITGIEKKEYTIFIQPKINAKDGSVMGGEALIRYKDSVRGILPPSAYIPMLEKNGLIRYIDLFVFEEVCKLINKWRKQGKKCPTISLNFSRLTMMEDNLIEMISSIVNKYNVPKMFIEIEITETYGNVGKTLLYQCAKQLHEAGFLVSLDDFGTEFTNLSILSDIHVDVLKIDRSLIHSMTTQTKNLTILKHVIDMCNELHICVIAEGVETMEQRNLLMDMGCVNIQGYLYSRPIDIETFEAAFLKKVK